MDSGYPIDAVGIREVKMTDHFWLPLIERIQQKTIAYAIEKCEEEGRMDNFLIAGGKMEGPVKGVMPFDDSDLYKIIEGASTSLISAPNPQLDRLLDSLISLIAVGQETDGYLTTWRTINPARPPAPWVKVLEGKRWESLEASHELYNAGHLYEAAAQHYHATGKSNFLDIALKNADLMVRTFGEGEGKIAAVPGHQIIESGLIKLYQITGRKDYLDLARYFLDHRGDPENHVLYGSYSQDHEPVIHQQEAVGHAVRAMYMYAAMTDIAAIGHDSAYRLAVDALWQNMVGEKMYLTGGIGARHEGEAFGENYELPNLTAYNETCAAIGSVYWNQRLFRLTGDSKYVDVIERTLYNGLISGISLDGVGFFYPNALESDGVYPFNRGACSRQSWFDCSCCPTNLIRFLPAMPELIYARQADTAYVNLFASSEARIPLSSNEVVLVQETNYPWEGSVRIKVAPAKPGTFTLKIRIPGWAKNEVLPGNLYHYRDSLNAAPEIRVNGVKQSYFLHKGYITLTQNWKSTNEIELTLPMQVRMVLAHERVAEDRGKASLEYGPLVYAVESTDQTTPFTDIRLTPGEHFDVRKMNNLLQGVNVIDGKGFRAIPYYAWANRGVSRMKVWIDLAQ